MRKMRGIGGFTIVSLTVGKNDAGQRLDRFIAKALPALSAGLIQKSIRTKKIKRNGKRAQRDDRLEENDLVCVYLPDALLAPPSEDDAWRRVRQPQLDILYEDANILLIDKKAGLSVQPDKNETVHTVSSYLKAYLAEKGEWKPEEENTFAPALCNRIDRNTAGIVIAAKNAETLRILNAKIKAREIKKHYLLIIHGAMTPPAGRLRHYLLKDTENNLVRVLNSPVPGALEAVTLYRTLQTRGALSLVECELVTGRTHQIRAQFAFCGCPLLGDGKYGRESGNKPYGQFTQALLSYRVTFDFSTPADSLSYLDQKTFSLGTEEFMANFYAMSDKRVPQARN